MAEDLLTDQQGQVTAYRSFRSEIYVARGLVIRWLEGGRQCSSWEWRRATSMESDTDLEYYRVLGSRNDQTLRCLLYFNLAPKLPSCGTHFGRSPRPTFYRILTLLRRLMAEIFSVSENCLLEFVRVG